MYIGVAELGFGVHFMYLGWKTHNLPLTASIEWTGCLETASQRGRAILWGIIAQY